MSLWNSIKVLRIIESERGKSDEENKKKLYKSIGQFHPAIVYLLGD